MDEVGVTKVSGTVSTEEVLAAIADGGLADWRKLAQPLAARYRVPGAVAGAAFVAAVAAAAEAAGLQPELRLGAGYAEVALSTVDAATGVRAVTAADLALAREVSRIAADHRLTAVPGELAQVEFALDTADQTTVGPFWAALLTGDAAHHHPADDAVLDPGNRVPPVWFQATEPHHPPRQRWHIDLWLAPEVADARIAAAIAAGGTVVDASHAPSFTVLADPDGNRACVCTALRPG